MTGSAESTRCIFCDAAAESDADSLIVYRGPTGFIILNRYPYNNGHLMVVPYRHVASLADARVDELSEMIDLARRAEIALTEAYHPQGMNIGINLGRPAGAGVADHVHMHIVPRWTGDTNFMSVVSGVRVLPEELSQTAARLRPIFARIGHVDEADRQPSAR